MTLRLQDNPLREGLRREKGAEPCTLVIFGGTGDLARRKLLPAIYNLQVDRLLPPAFAVVGAARKEIDQQKFERTLRDSITSFSRRTPSEELLSPIAEGLSFVATGEAGGYRRLAEHLDVVDRERATSGNRLFYLATPPGAFPSIIEGLHSAGLHRPGKGGSWSRIVLEKPIGHDLASARELNRTVNEAFHEQSVFRIDHYLGKETVQNMLVFRFANSIFEPLWNQKYVDHVQITVAETLGVGGRGEYYERAGTTRDMMQNHIFQLLCLTAMEPPVSLEADAIRDEKVKVLQALRPVVAEQVRETSARGQYAAGTVDGESVLGYLEEEGVDPASRTETFVALQLHVDNWRWAGVPFYLRSGKRLPKRVSEIALHFRDVPHRLFDQDLEANTLALRIQPDEGITLHFDSKVPGSRPRIQPVSMEFRYGTSFGQEPPEAYERLILDAMLGDSTLFIRRDEVEASWRHIDALMDGWNADAEPLPAYVAGQWGPTEAEELLSRSGRRWRRL
jgi:glucose-6-phosphate 1-dehydrogenase